MAPLMRAKVFNILASGLIGRIREGRKHEITSDPCSNRSTEGGYTSEIIVTEHLQMIYPNGVEAVKDLSIGVRKGEVFGFLGPNGAGKSTALNMMVGLLKPIQGRQ